VTAKLTKKEVWQFGRREFGKPGDSINDLTEIIYQPILRRLHFGFEKYFVEVFDFDEIYAIPRMICIVKAKKFTGGISNGNEDNSKR
jgi:hypothetical protein